MAGVPPRPPPHASSPKSSNLPNGNYDIFIIPPHSAGSGFLYLPSLKPNINSFIAGFCTCLLAVCVYNVLVPALRQTLSSLNSGIGILFALLAVGVAFSIGRSSNDSNPFASSDANSSRADPNFDFPSSPPPQQPPPPPRPNGSANSSWEKAKEETKRREAERKKAEEARQAAEAATRRKEEAEKTARASAEKERWEQARAREKDTREREARERIAKERAAKEAAAAAGGGQRYEKPSAQSTTDSAFARDAACKRPFAASATSSTTSGSDASSYAPSMSTARTEPPPATPSSNVPKGPYRTADPNKVMVSGVYLFTAGFPKPVSMLVRGRDGVTDGLILRITTEGLFIDDDVRGVPQREWDVKAWGIKLVETGKLDGMHVFRASIRDPTGKQYVFVLPAEQAWKVDIGLERLRKGSQVRAMGMNGIKDGEMKSILQSLGWR